jgi:hypothetical protein
VIQLVKEGFSGSADIEILRDQFERTHTTRLRQLIHPDLMRRVWHSLDNSRWKDLEHKRIGREVMPEDQVMVAALNFVVNTPGFLEVIRQITGCAGINQFAGRIYRMLPNCGHSETWHNDMKEPDRLVGMSVNLGSDPYCGGVFRLRDSITTEVLAELPNTGRGDAILFRISKKLEHEVTTVEGTIPKTAFAGWFKAAERDLFSLIRATRPGLASESDA